MAPVDVLTNWLMGGSGRGFTEAALIVCFFWAALSRPERIRNTTEFRVAVIFLCLSIVTPIALQVFVLGFRGQPPRPGMPGNAIMDMVLYLMAIPPMFTMLAVILGIDSVIPKRNTPSAPTYD